jgi:hypothetical protein
MIELNETHSIFDSSKIDSYLRCPRSFFYRYILGWEIDSDNYHLIFGQAWHKGMEVIMKEGCNVESLEKAFVAFMAHYREYFPDSAGDAGRGVKTPEKALLGYTTYIDFYKHDDFETIETEIGGSVSIGENRNTSFRIDAVCKNDVGYFVMEHKTASADSSSWRNQWALSIQLGMYIHVLHCMLEGEVWGARVNGAIFRSKDVGLVRIPVRKTIEQMQQWYYIVQKALEDIEKDTEKLLVESKKGLHMKSFQMNPVSCTAHFGTCPYHDLCLCWHNPLEKVNEVPSGFRVRWWNPLTENTKDAKKVVIL